MLHQVHLNAPNCSGRGVRFKVLSPYQRDTIGLAAARSLDPDATMFDVHIAEQQYGIRAMIVQYTAKSHKGEVPNDAEWVTVEPSSFEREYANLFTAKDHAILNKLYTMHHNVAKDEVDAIVGKTRLVSTD